MPSLASSPRLSRPSRVSSCNAPRPSAASSSSAPRPSAASLRRELEAALASRVPGAFTVHARPQPEMASCGVAAVDALTGGLPRGALTEIFGPASSGRTSLLLAALAAATRRDEFCCLVDTGDAFDPQSAAAAGVELDRLLWVRCGTPISNSKFKIQNPWLGRVEQALKAADLLLQGSPTPVGFAGGGAEGSPTPAGFAGGGAEGGGFGMVALDLAGVPPRAARRVPLTSWFRFRRAVEHTSAVLLLLSPEPLTQSCASLLLKLEPEEQRLSLGTWHLARSEPSAFSNQHPAADNLLGNCHSEKRSAEGPALEATEQPIPPATRNDNPEAVPTHARLLQGLDVRAEVVRAQFANRKPPRAAQASFQTRASWAG